VSRIGTGNGFDRSHSCREWRVISTGNRLAPVLLIVDKPTGPGPTMIAVCPSCGLAAADSPHANSDQCVRALEAEVARLAALIKQFKQQRGDGSRKGR
jgi:hypothetical protein